MDLPCAFCISHVSESRVFSSCILASHELFNVILPLCFAMFLLSVLGSLEGGEGPGSFFWIALGKGGLAACARKSTEGLYGALGAQQAGHHCLRHLSAE